jgi:hypothetical protein
VLVYDGESARVMPDFLVSHELSSCLREPASLVVVPLLPVVRRITGDRADVIPDPTTRPASKVVGRDGDVWVEYAIHLGGPLGFELVRESARTIGLAKTPEPSWEVG